jgi:hypothetical protein
MRALAAAVVLVVTAAPGVAQTVASQPAHRVEVDAGGGLFGGTAFGDVDATLRTNAQAREPFRLFTAGTRVDRARSIHVRAGVDLSPRFGVEGGVTRSRPHMRTAITADAENAAALTTVQRIDQYVFDASLVLRFGGFGAGGRLVPFVSAGGGYLRQLHEGRTLIEHGQAYHAGGGVKYAFVARTTGRLRSTGVRGDARLQVLRGGISLRDRPRSQAAISGSVFVAF